MCTPYFHKLIWWKIVHYPQSFTVADILQNIPYHNYVVLYLLLHTQNVSNKVSQHSNDSVAPYLTLYQYIYAVSFF